MTPLWSLSGDGDTDLGAVGAANGLSDPIAGSGEGIEVDAAVDPQAVEQVDDVFACDVSGGAFVAIERGQPPSGCSRRHRPWSDWGGQWFE